MQSEAEKIAAEIARLPSFAEVIEWAWRNGWHAGYEAGYNDGLMACRGESSDIESDWLKSNARRALLEQSK